MCAFFPRRRVTPSARARPPSSQAFGYGTYSTDESQLAAQTVYAERGLTTSRIYLDADPRVLPNAWFAALLPAGRSTLFYR